jgi:phosphatidylserine/phosphatidylglycerophosphate/cardiolipin synthase-like enzyme
MQTEAFFTGIRAILLQEIGLARHSIVVAVAWFTDQQLFRALLAQQRAGVAVSVCLTRDEQDINFRPGGLPFIELEAAGGRVWVVEDSLMHHKFCVLDGRDVVTGSYNWTNKAAQENQENVVLTTGDPELAQRFTREFHRLTGQLEPPAGDPAVERILKRLGLIKSMLALHETEDLPKQVERLAAEGITDDRLARVLEALRTRRYADAIARLDEFVAAHSQLRVWEDPQLPALQLEIWMLEAELLALDTER